MQVSCNPRVVLLCGVCVCTCNAGACYPTHVAGLCCRYAASEPAVGQQLLEGHAFEKFVESIAKVADLHGDIPAAYMVEMYVALMHFTDGVYPDKLENVNKVLGACHQALSGR